VLVIVAKVDGDPCPPTEFASPGTPPPPPIVIEYGVPGETDKVPDLSPPAPPAPE
jgi:hypothetical protein